jgi:hypothetical protein
MSDVDPWDDVEYAIRFFETEIIGRKMSADERSAFENAHRENAPARARLREEMNPMLRARATLAFMKQLKARQGTVTPDFNALYQKKSELDRKLMGDDLHDRP